MKKIDFKRLFVVLFIFLIASFSNLCKIDAQAATTYTYTYSGVTYSYSGTTLTITGSGSVTNDWWNNSNSALRSYRTTVTTVKMTSTNITSVGDNAFNGCTALKSLTIGSKVTSIGSSSFSGCTALATLSVPNTVTSIGSSAFSGCTAMTTVTIGTGVTSIGSNAFYNCPVTTTLAWNALNCTTYNDAFSNKTITTVSIGTTVQYIPNNFIKGNTSVTSITIPKTCEKIGNSAFYNCSSLKTLTFTATQVCTSFGDYSFFGCSSLTSITIPNSVTSVGTYAFYGCSKITTLNTGTGVATIGAYAFYNCSAMTTVTVGTGVKSIGTSAFYGCNAITTLTWNAENCTVYNDAFSTKTSITKVTLGSTVTSIPNNFLTNTPSLTQVGATANAIIIPNSVETIGIKAFYGCSKSTITTVTIGTGVTYIGSNAFSNCSNLTKLNWNSLNCTTYNDAFTNKNIATVSIGTTVTMIPDNFVKNNTSITSITVQNTVESIGTNAFYGCTKLATVSIGTNVETIWKNAFYGCDSITTLTWNAKDCGAYSDAFAEKNITTVTLGTAVVTIPTNFIKGNTAVTTITIPVKTTTIGDSAFYGCEAITTVKFTATPTCATINSYAFYGCKALTSITVPDTVTLIGSHAFASCDVLNTVTIGKGVTEFGSDSFDNTPVATKLTYNATNCTKYNYAFFAKDIATVTIGSTVQTIPDYFIYNNDAATTISIPATVTSIGACAFSSCDKLATVTFAGTSTCASIGTEAFSWCTALTAITVPNSVKTIGNQAFEYCSSLETVKLGTTTASLLSTIGDSAFKNCNNIKALYFYNKNTTIPSNTNTVSNSAIMYVYGNSTAETYAKTYSKPYIYLDNTVSGTTTNQNGGTDGKISWTITSVGVLNINPSTAKASSDMNDYSSGSAPWYKYRNGITSIVISPYVTKIGRYAFYGLKNATKCTFTATASCTSIGDYAFYGCSSLTDILNGKTSYTLPTTITNIGTYAFRDCSSMATIIISNGVTRIDNYAFWNCSKLTTVTVGTGVTYIGINAFYNCPVTTSLTWNATNCTTYNSAFSDKQIAKVTIGSAVQIIPSYFIKNNEVITSVIIPKTCTEIGSYAFYGCKMLASITNNSTSFTQIKDYTFYGCMALTSFTVHDNVTSIGIKAFYDCENLNTVSIGKSVTEIKENAFYGSPVATKLTWNAINCTTYNDAFVGKKIAEVAIGTSVQIIPENFIKGNTVVSSITIPKSCTEIKDSAFSGCKKLSSLTFTTTPTCTKIDDYAFYGCSALASLTVPDSVTTIGNYAFQKCTSLNTVVIGTGVTSIGEKAFVGAPVATKLTWNAKNCTNYNCAFTEKDAATVTIGTNVETIPSNFISRNTKIISIEIPKNVKTIGSYAFSGCTSLGTKSGNTTGTVKISSTVLETIGDYAFYNCSGITKITNSATSTLKTIGNYAFAQDTKLTQFGATASTVTIPSSCTSVGEHAFENTGETKLTFTATSTCKNIGAYAFYECNITKANATISSIPSSATIGVHAFPWEESDDDEVWNFSYTGSYQTFTAPYTGKYYIQTWGAQGGGTYAGGGYSFGYITLYQGQKLYISVGGKGTVTSTSSTTLQTGSGGWNGGGDAMGGAGGGGGATSVTTTLRGTGLLTDYKSYKDEILMVAGGSGGKGSRMKSYSTDVTVSSDGMIHNYVNGAVSATNQTTIGGHGGGLTTDDWGATHVSGYGSVVGSGTIFCTNAGSEENKTRFGKGENGVNVHYYDGYPGAGGGGYVAGDINKGKDNNETYKSTYSTGILGGAGGTGYTNDDVIQSGGTTWDYKVTEYNNAGSTDSVNGKAKITFSGYAKTTLTIDTNGLGTIEISDSSVAVEKSGNQYIITGNVGQTISFPEITLNKGNILSSYTQKSGSLDTDSNGNIKLADVPTTYTFGTQNTILVANCKSKMTLDITQASDNEYNIKINSAGDTAEIFKVLTSLDGKEWTMVATESDYETNNESTEKKFSYIKKGSLWNNSILQSYVAPASGYYYIEATGASYSYGDLSENLVSSIGGFSYGYKYLNEGDIIYVAVGGRGYGIHKGTYNGTGGWNGGGTGRDHSNRRTAGGGGATSWTTTNRGELSNYSSYRSEVILVAGGAGGGMHRSSNTTKEDAQGGAGGGTTGVSTRNAGTGGTQASAGAGGGFGKGGSTPDDETTDSGGGGGGWYGGGYATTDDDGGGGGSGYIESVINNVYCGVFNGATTQGESSKSSVGYSLDGTAYIKLYERVYTSSAISNVHLVDKAAPNAPKNGQKTKLSNGKLRLTWSPNEDNGTTSYYKVESYALGDDYSDVEKDPLGDDNLLETSDVISKEYTSGVAGYYYYYDNSFSGTVYNTATATLSDLAVYSDDAYVDITQPTTTTWMHVAAVDAAGNIGSTYSFMVYTSHTLTVKPNGGTWNSTTSNSTFTMGENETKTIANPTRTGYTFNGWTVSGTGSTLSGVTFTMGTADAALTANWTANTDTKYIVNHYLMSTITSEYTLQDTETKTGITDSTITIDNLAKSYTGFTYIGGKGQTISSTSKPSSFDTTTTILANGNRVINLYYDRNSYSVTYKDVVETESGKELGTKTVEKLYGLTVRGSDLGSSTVDNAYYTGYKYISDTSATVGTSGTTVYRFFRSTLISISGTVKWVDKSNEYNSRPDSVTVYLLANGEVVAKKTGFTGSNTNSFTFTDVSKYDSSGNEIVYTVSESEVVSKNAPEDKYETDITGNASSGFVIKNTLQNSDGFTVKGSITWKDNNNELGYRPEDVIIKLYRDGIFYDSITKDKYASEYAFANLDRYIYDEDGTVTGTHTYYIVETLEPMPSYVVDGETKNAYTIEYSVPVIDAKDGSAIIDITNIFDNAGSPIPVKPYNSDLAVKTNQDVYTEVILKRMDEDYVDNGSVVYKDTYSDVYYNVEVNNIAKTIMHIVEGKYEITTTSSLFTIDSMELSDAVNVTLVKENGKYYVIIKEAPEDAYGLVTINLSKKDHIGYQSGPDLVEHIKYKEHNYWKVAKFETSETKATMKASRRVVVPMTEEVSEGTTSKTTTETTSEKKTGNISGTTTDTTSATTDTSENTKTTTK